MPALSDDTSFLMTSSLKNKLCMLTCPFHLLSFQFIVILSLAAFLAFVAAIMGFVFIGKVHLSLGCQRNIDDML